VRVRIVAVLGDANLLTARRSTAARSAKQPSLSPVRPGDDCRGSALDNLAARRAGLGFALGVGIQRIALVRAND
jgi:hypothetical protein